MNLGLFLIIQEKAKASTTSVNIDLIHVIASLYKADGICGGSKFTLCSYTEHNKVTIIKHVSVNYCIQRNSFWKVCGFFSHTAK